MPALSNYLSGGRTRQRSKSYGGYFPQVSRYTPYPVPRRAAAPVQTYSPFAGQDLNSALLASQQNRKIATPSSTFDNPYDYDPILTKIQAISAASLANANTEAEQLRRQAIIDTGDTGIAQELKFDPNTISAAGQNPESIMSQLSREFAQRSKDLAESYSSQNLMYSGAYTDALSELARGRASAETSAGDKLRSLLSGVDTNLLSAQETARQQTLDAQQAAALAQSYGNSWGTGAGGAGGGMIQWSPGSQSALAAAGYSDEDVASSIDAYAKAHGWGPAVGVGGYGLQQNGQRFNQFGVLDPNGQYVQVKVGTPAGNSTELIPIGPPPAGSGGGGGGGSTPPPGPATPPPPLTIEQALANAQTAPTTPLDYVLGSGTRSGPSYF